MSFHSVRTGLILHQIYFMAKSTVKKEAASTKPTEINHVRRILTLEVNDPASFTHLHSELKAIQAAVNNSLKVLNKLRIESVAKKGSE